MNPQFKQAEADWHVLRAQQGSQRSLAWLFEHFQAPALRFALRTCWDRELAQDAVQEAWLEVAGNLRKLDDPRAFRAWLFRLVRWRALDQLRRNQRHQRGRTDVETSELSAPDTSSKLDLLEQIERLPQIERQVIHLFYLEQCSINEIAAVIEIPVGTVKSRLHRAREQLKTILEADDAPSLRAVSTQPGDAE